MQNNEETWNYKKSFLVVLVFSIANIKHLEGGDLTQEEMSEFTQQPIVE